MIGAIFINDEAFYPDYGSKKVKIPQSIQVDFYDVSAGISRGKANINSGTYRINNYQRVNGRMYLFTAGFWLLASDLTQYLINGGVIRALCSTTYKALRHFQSLEVAI